MLVSDKVSEYLALKLRLGHVTRTIFTGTETGDGSAKDTRQSDVSMGQLLEAQTQLTRAVLNFENRQDMEAELRNMLDRISDEKSAAVLPGHSVQSFRPLGEEIGSICGSGFASPSDFHDGRGSTDSMLNAYFDDADETRVGDTGMGATMVYDV